MIKHDSKFAYLYEFILGKGDIYTFKLKKVLIGEINKNNIFYESCSNKNYIALDKYLEAPEIGFSYYQEIDFRDDIIMSVFEKFLVSGKLFDVYKDYYYNLNIKTGEVIKEEIEEVELEYIIDEMYNEYLNLVIKGNECKFDINFGTAFNPDKEDLYNLLIDIETSPLMKYYAIAGDNNVDLHIDYNICEKIAEKSLELNTGARSLDGIVSNLFSEIYYILECYNDVTSLCIYDITEEDNKLKLVYSVETKNVLGISKVRSAQN